MPADDDAATPAVVPTAPGGPVLTVRLTPPEVEAAAPGGPVLTVRLTPPEVEAARTAAESRAAGTPFAFAPVQVVSAPPEE